MRQKLKKPFSPQKKMKILILNAPSKTGKASIPPLGICYLASVLRKKYKIKLIDLDIEKFPFEILKKTINLFYPDIVMISAVTPQMENAYRIANKIKEININCKIIMGGAHVSALPKQTLTECKSIDIAVIGEGEETIQKICSTFNKKNKEFMPNIENILNISYRKKDKIISNPLIKILPDVKTLPLPSRDLLKFKEYTGWGPTKAKPSTHLIASRGCPFDCIFCSEKKVFGQKNRRREPKDVVKEITLLKKKYGIKEFAFYDDLFTANKSWVREVCKELIKKKINLPWKALSRVDTVDLKTLKLMKKAGCWLIFYGYESGCDTILKKINKHTTIKHGTQATENTRKAGIKIYGFFMLGNESEDKETIKKTILYAKKINPTFSQFAIVRPDPGSPQYEKYIQEITSKHTSWEEYHAFSRKNEGKVMAVGTKLKMGELQDYAEIGKYLLDKKELLKDIIRTLVYQPKLFIEKTKKIYLPSIFKNKLAKL
jgi:anaerobic magnesium-protoporphyrin IX monomethyl ester cyclase